MDANTDSESARSLLPGLPLGGSRGWQEALAAGWSPLGPLGNVPGPSNVLADLPLPPRAGEGRVWSGSLPATLLRSALVADDEGSPADAAAARADTDATRALVATGRTGKAATLRLWRSPVFTPARGAPCPPLPGRGVPCSAEPEGRPGPGRCWRCWRWVPEGWSADKLDALPDGAQARLAGAAATPPPEGVPLASELPTLPLLLPELDPRATIWMGDAVATPAGGGKATGHP